MLERAFNNAVERGLVRRCIEGGTAMEFGGNADIERAFVGFFRQRSFLSTEIEICIDRVVKVIDQFLNGLTFVGNYTVSLLKPRLMCYNMSGDENEEIRDNH